jgi:hypothetical protein
VFFVPLRRTKPDDVSSEADQLERELGRREAVLRVRQCIIEADREARRRLYRLHDELARRAPYDPGFRV